MQSEECSICARKIKSENSHFCPNCKKRSHAKCNGIEPKFIKNIWLCKLCRNQAFPEDQSHDQLPIGKDISYLKSYFKHLNTIPSKFSDIDSQTSDQDDFEDHTTKFSCKYFSPEDFLSLPPKKQSLSCFHLNISSLNKHFDNLSALLSRLNHKFDILGISETLKIRCLLPRDTRVQRLS